MTRSHYHADAAAFLAAIVADPNDDTARLVFADWLQENDDPDRAEFIRAQCRIAAINAGIQSDEDCGQPGCAECDERRPLLARESALLSANREQWLRVECPNPQCQNGYWPHSGDPMTRPNKCHYCQGTGDVGGLALVKGNGDPRHEVVFRRGFPHEVRGCRLADVLERERVKCETCNGTGVIDYRDGDGEMHCIDCRGVRTILGDWKPTPWALRVFRAHPTIRAVPLVDKIPERRPGIDLYRYWREDPSRAESSIPGVLYDHIERWLLSGTARFLGNREIATARLAVAVADVIRAATEHSRLPNGIVP